MKSLVLQLLLLLEQATSTVHLIMDWCALLACVNLH
jgi:hypothetical protein